MRELASSSSGSVVTTTRGFSPAGSWGELAAAHPASVTTRSVCVTHRGYIICESWPAQQETASRVARRSSRERRDLNLRPPETPCRSSGDRLTAKLTAGDSLQRHRNSLELLALCECDFGNGAAILQRWRDTQCAEAGVAFQGCFHSGPQRDLRLGHRRTLALCGGVIFAFSNRLGLDDRTAVGIDNYLEELSTRHRIDREL